MAHAMLFQQLNEQIAAMIDPGKTDIRIFIDFSS